MGDLLKLIWYAVAGLFRSRAALQTEALALRSWSELGGPPVKPPTRKGFGTHVIEAMLRSHVGGDVGLDWRAGGLVWAVTLPARGLQKEANAPDQA
jgi:two-component sensor histidine kinase